MADQQGGMYVQPAACHLLAAPKPLNRQYRKQTQASHSLGIQEHVLAHGQAEAVLRRLQRKAEAPHVVAQSLLFHQGKGNALAGVERNQVCCCCCCCGCRCCGCCRRGGGAVGGRCCCRRNDTLRRQVACWGEGWGGLAG